MVREAVGMAPERRWTPPTAPTPPSVAPDRMVIGEIVDDGKRKSPDDIHWRTLRQPFQNQYPSGTLTPATRGRRGIDTSLLREPQRLYRRRRVFPAPLVVHDELRHVDPAATDFNAGDPPLGVVASPDSAFT